MTLLEERPDTLDEDDPMGGLSLDSPLAAAFVVDPPQLVLDQLGGGGASPSSSGMHVVNGRLNNNNDGVKGAAGSLGGARAVRGSPR